MKEDLSKYNPEGSTLRKAQLRMLDMLIEIDKIFRAHHINYWLDSGTLLGAVRHKGFIPWDDDVDVCVMRTDYKKIKEILLHELPQEFVFVDADIDKYYFDACGRVKSVNSYVDIPEYRYQKEQGIYIDIYPMEVLYSANHKYFGEKIYGKIFRHYHNSGMVVTSSFVRRNITKIMACFLYPLVLGLIMLMRWWGSRRPNVIAHGFGIPLVRDHTYKSSWIFPLTEIEFEGRKLLAPNNYDACLKSTYGDYMQIPPKEKRVVHSSDWKIW